MELSKYKQGFTLAEVLITIVIIGAIAAMTIPNLLNNSNAQEFRTAMKKAISAVNQALELSYAVDGVTAQDYSTPSQLVDYIFKMKMSTMDVANSFTNSEVCQDGVVFATTDGFVYCISSNYATTDGTYASEICDIYNEHPCAVNQAEPNMWIDVNGAKKPNKITVSANSPRDIYQAMIYSQKVEPFGIPSQRVAFDEGTGSDVQAGNNTPPASNPGGSGDEGKLPAGFDPDNFDPDNFDPGDLTPDDIPYDPNHWPTFLDFLRWLAKIFGISI